MPTAPLPQDPNLEQLRNQARELQRAVRAGDRQAAKRVASVLHDPPEPAGFALTAAQRVIARELGFASWARLRRYVDIVTARSWTPGATVPGEESPTDRFLRLACLTSGQDAASDRSGAALLLAEHPELPASSVLVAAACADVAQLRRLLATDPSLATVTGGPHNWSPLLYQAYARHDPQVGLSATLETARLLLTAGADPNDGRFWHGLPTPYTVLTGVLGHGDDPPWHPWATPFARGLLEAGADPNDGQTLYNRMFGINDDHLVLLFEFGLGQDTRGPWHRLLGEALDPPSVMLVDLLHWAVTHDQRERVALLAAHGVDVVSPFAPGGTRFGGGRTPVEAALVNGHRELAEMLRSLGARPPRLRPVEAFVAAALSGDAEAVRGADPDVLATARRERFGLLTWAAGRGDIGAVELLVSVGFDVNSYGRSDAPTDQAWHTALHVAAGDGNLALAETLLRLGADPRLRDRRFGATPLDWAQHFGQDVLIDLLSLCRTCTAAGRRSEGGIRRIGGKDVLAGQRSGCRGVASTAVRDLGVKVSRNALTVRARVTTDGCCTETDQHG